MSFENSKTARDLPKETLLDLIERTSIAHKNLNRVWHNALINEVSLAAADEMLNTLWPQNQNWQSLFIDDLRFVITAGKLKPDLLTFASNNTTLLPENLTTLGPAFQLLVSVAGLGKNNKANSKKTSKPAWTGSPNKIQAWFRGKGIDAGFAALEKLWQKTESKKSYQIDIENYQKQLETLSNEQLELLWNYSAIAYMFVTSRWYQAVAKKYSADIAQKIEKLVWLDLEAAEYDLDIGLQAIQEKGTTVESLLKGFQFAPGEVGILDVDFNLIDENHGILTHKTCPATDRFEHYDDSRLKHSCEICILGMPISGEMLDKDIKCKALKLPPRKDANDIACQWEYIYLESVN